MIPTSQSKIRPRALVVDDDRNCRRLMTAVLRAALGELCVAHAASGTEAINWLATSRFEFVVTDLDIPLAEGVQVVRVARRLNPDAVVVVTAAGPGRDVESAIAAGASLALGKPFEVEQLIAYLRREGCEAGPTRDAARQGSAPARVRAATPIGAAGAETQSTAMSVPARWESLH